jgi:uncharacterized protein YcbX
VDGKPEKVICKTCNRKHKYRPNLPKSRQKSSSADKTKKKRTTRARKRKDPAVIWEEAFAERDASDAKGYAMTESFEQDDVIDHKTFGVGLVTEVRAEGKMEVMFKDGTKLLVHDREDEDE